MASSLKLWGGLAVVGCAAVAVALLPPAVHDSPDSGLPYSLATPERRWELRVQRAVQRAAIEFEWSAALDRLLAESRQPRPAGSGLTVRFSAGWPPDWQRETQAALDSVWTALEIGTEVDVVLVAERGRTPLIYALPEATGRNTCAISIARHHQERPLRYWPTIWLSLCAYYAEFGRPGKAIGDWLFQASHITGSLAWDRPADQDPYVRRHGVPLPPLQRRFFYYSQYFDSWDSAACARGEPDRCRSAILAGNLDRYYWDSDIMMRPGVLARPYWGRSDSYLADLVREMGRERFSRFWRSPESVEQAFASAFGVALGEWTMKWQRARTLYLPPNPTVPVSAPFYALLVMAGALGLAAVFSGRRQVG